MIQMPLIQIIRGVCESPSFPILPYLMQLRYIIAHLLDVERGVSSISPNVLHPTYRNKNIQLTSINKLFQLSPCIVIFLVLFKCMVHPRLDTKDSVELFLAVQECKCPIISCFFYSIFWIIYSFWGRQRQQM